MDQPSFKLYRYRWVMLLVFMFIIAVNQLLWISFAPITGSAAVFYGVTDLSIGLLSMSFMIVFIIISIPASWAIDTYGVRWGVGLGAALTGIFGMLRGLLAADYSLVLLAQIGIALGQPLILNAVTKVAARWFPLEERATASGLATLAMYLGIVVAMVLTPFLTLRNGIESMLLMYGVLSLAAAITFLVFSRERPPSPPCPPGEEERSLVFDGLRSSLRKADFKKLLAVFFVGLGTFNAVTTWIEDILRPRGFSVTQAGMAGGLMVFAGVLGAVVIPIISDKQRKRVPFLVVAVIGAIPGLLGITFATSYPILLASAFVLGFFLLSAGPIGFQYGAEITYPAPEGTSNGLLLLAGQVSGVIFILTMDSLRSPSTGAMTASLGALVVLMVLALALAASLKESQLLEQHAQG